MDEKMMANASNSDVISLTSSDEEDKISGRRNKKFKVGSVDILPHISLTPVRNSPNNVILLDSDDEGSEINENSNGNGTGKEVISPANKRKVKNPINVLLKKNGITVRQKGEIVQAGSVVIDSDSSSDSDNTDIEKNEKKRKNLHQDVFEKDNNVDKKNCKINNRPHQKRQRSNGTRKDNTKEANSSMKSHINGESIIIDDSDDDTEKENHCENDIEPFPVNMDKTSTSEVSFATIQDESRMIFKKFLKIVEEKIVDSSFEEMLPKKMPIIEKYFTKCGKNLNKEEFELILSDLIENIQTSQNSKAARVAVMAFHKVFAHLKSHASESAIIIEKDDYPKVKKLEHTLKLLKKKIKELDEDEVDINIDNDNDSSYIMVDKYLTRYYKVYAKYCQYIGRNPLSRASNDKIYYVNSKHNAINKALSRKYQNHLNFPSYYELKKFIEKVAKKENLNLSEQELRQESEVSFEYLGSIMQKKRKHELYASHLNLIEFTDDPAAKDISLENVLKKNFSEGKEKIDKVFQLYVNKQNQGEDYMSAHEDETSEESDVEKTKNCDENKKEETSVDINGKNEENKNEENSVEKINENEENISEIIKMDKGKTLMNGTKTVKKKSKQLTEEINEAPDNATDASVVEEKTDDSNVETTVDSCAIVQINTEETTVDNCADGNLA